MTSTVETDTRARAAEAARKVAAIAHFHAKRGATWTAKSLVKAAWVSLCRLARGLRYLIPDLIWWLTAERYQKSIDVAESAVDRQRAELTKRKAAAAARGWAMVWLLALVSVVFADPPRAHDFPIPVMPLLTATLALTSTAVMWHGKQSKEAKDAKDATSVSWAWPVRLGVVFAVALGAEYLVLVQGVGIWTIREAVAALIFAVVTYVCGDGSARDNLGGPKTGEMRVEPHSRIVHALCEALGLKEEDVEKFTVIGGGLKQVDDVWSDIVVQAPGTITTKRIVDAADKLASVMGLVTDRVSICEDGAEGVVRISIASKDQWNEIRPWPLLTAETYSVWEPMPFAWDERGRTVTVAQMFAGWLIASIPRVGKTLALRMLVLAWLKDPTTDVACFDLKGGRDFLMCQPMCVAWGHGRSDDTIRALRDYLLTVQADGEQRKAAFNALPTSLVPAGQLTREAVEADRRLRPLLIAIDEVHWATTHEEYGEEIINLLSQIAKDLPYLGVEEALASQRLDAKETMPTKLRNVLANRFALKLYSGTDSKMVLGDAANGLGFNAAALPKKKGLGYLHGTDDTSSIDGYMKVRTFYHDAADVEGAAKRAETARRAAGVLPEVTTQPPVPELVQALRIVRASGQPSIRSADLAEQMDTTPQRLIARIGVRSRQEPTDGYCKHVYLEDLEIAVEAGGRSLRVVS